MPKWGRTLTSIAVNGPEQQRGRSTQLDWILDSWTKRLDRHEYG